MYDVMMDSAARTVGAWLARTFQRPPTGYKLDLYGVTVSQDPESLEWMLTGGYVRLVRSGEALVELAECRFDGFEPGDFGKDPWEGMPWDAKTPTAAARLTEAERKLAELRDIDKEGVCCMGCYNSHGDCVDRGNCACHTVLGRKVL